jgi:hypothetical protein
MSPETTEPEAQATKAVRQPASGAIQPASAIENAAPMPKNAV